ncbi:DUF1129 domain-containing protein [Fundicoccus culcitae]|uniref:DUF1129 domain-containing protein n=1 Tax=Fundicoccus culcitae TaxID=2969821 RepID=A0ABY5P3Q7_9LACT|nr:DUF1129 family protein [Fundicoccus culcitae]UUX33093.1 DUF1129 domain-containing protein [Fundicoccus culcitae]
MSEEKNTTPQTDEVVETLEREESTETTETTTENNLNKQGSTNKETEKPQSLSEQMSSDDYVIYGVTPEVFNQLTKKNQQFIIAVDRQLQQTDIAPSALAAVYLEIAETLIQGQSTGQTAKHLYGTPTEAVAVIKEQKFPTQDQLEPVRSPDWQIALDGSLILGSIYVALTGFSLINNATEEVTYQGMGIITVIVNYIMAGLAMLQTSKVLPNPDAPKGKKGYFKYFGVATLSMVAWILSVVLTSTFIPPSINIPVPGEWLLGIGLATFALRFYLKRKLNIQGGIF